MNSICPYCSKLVHAVSGNNFCSKIGDNIQKVDSNAFYFNANNLHSGDHISRLTFRTINKGYQYHEVGQKKFMLDQGKYLIINEGEPYKSEVDTVHPIEGLVVAFSYDQALKADHFLNSTHEQLLDDPFQKKQSLHFVQQSFNQTKEIQAIVNAFKGEILKKEHNTLVNDEKFHQLMLLMLKERAALYSKVELLKVKKETTKIEIFKRLSIGKEYIDNHTEENISLEKLSRVSIMSPFHLLRCFKEFYGVTPHRYLNIKKMEKAKFLLEDTSIPVQKIARTVGFDHVRSFRRAFKKSNNISPHEYRTRLLEFS